MFGGKEKVLPFTLIDIGSYSIRGAFVEVKYKLDEIDYEDFRVVSYAEEIFRDNKIDTVVMWRENSKRLLEKLKAKNPTIRMDKYLKKVVVIFSPFNFLNFKSKWVEEDIISSDSPIYLSSSLLGRMLKSNIEKFSDSEKLKNFALFMPYIKYFIWGKNRDVDGEEKILFTPWGYKILKLKAKVNYITWSKEYEANVIETIKRFFPGLNDSLKTHSIIADLWGISPVYKRNLNIANKFWSLIDIGHKFVNVIFSYNRIEKISKVLNVEKTGENIIKIIENFYTLVEKRYDDLMFSDFVSEVFATFEEYLKMKSRSNELSSYFNDFRKKYGKELVSKMFEILEEEFESLADKVADGYVSFLIEFLKNSDVNLEGKILVLKIFLTGRIATLNFFRKLLEFQLKSHIGKKLKKFDIELIFDDVNKSMFKDKFFFGDKNNYVPLTLIGGINLAYYYNRLGLFGRNEFGGFLDSVFNSLKKIGKFLEKAI